MKTWFLGFLAAFIFLVTGCNTARVNWESRVGNYTYDQAVLELGPPDKSAKLTDGAIVAEWLTYRGSRGSSYFYSPSPYYFSPYYEPPTPDRFLRLTFDPEGRLRAWQRVAK